ncbi:MAG: GTPase HflX [Chloroflexi bacterium CG08_land_8_20_14_0_20_45_12]|nr:MAG: GTPase HflX [Chloroflexi bacterium CG08_land_8_20_14_0_20_45_12]PIX27055.1 MAG: GTPase HflX [Chloroflexi bacterium CG_4_8_14_3_um_filter_45_15]
MKQKLFSTETSVERAFLVGVETKSADDKLSITDSLQELSYLVQSAGATVVGMFFQKLDMPSPTHYIGKGKLAELISLREQTYYDTVIFNDELSPRQQRNLEETLGVKVIDRTTLILDIFAKKARTREGQIQVELAQHQYLLPRLVGQWSHLERLGGGIGTRGPGESQLESDRRLIHKRVSRIEREIENVKKHRTLYRRRRKEVGIPVAALVGYTNAGKSTLFNTLSNAGVIVEDKLFSTLDPVTRRLALPDGRQFLLTDTVGFIHKLPPSIVSAFRATLEELSEAELLLHIVDITHKNAANQCHTVEKILGELDLKNKLRITVFNKLDLALNNEAELEALNYQKSPSSFPYFKEQIPLPDERIALISAKKGWGIDKLLAKIACNLQ